MYKLQAPSSTRPSLTLQQKMHNESRDSVPKRCSCTLVCKHLLFFHILVITSPASALSLISTLLLLGALFPALASSPSLKENNIHSYHNLLLPPNQKSSTYKPCWKCYTVVMVRFLGLLSLSHSEFWRLAHTEFHTHLAVDPLNSTLIQ